MTLDSKKSFTDVPEGITLRQSRLSWIAWWAQWSHRMPLKAKEGRGREVRVGGKCDIEGPGDATGEDGAALDNLK